MINQLKTVLFLGILSGILLAIGFLLGGSSGLTIALVFAILINFASYFFSHKIVIALYRAKPISKQQNPELHKIVEDLSKQANIPKPKIYLVPSDSNNAFATGPNYKNSVVAVTQGILKLLSKEELKGVLAHEIAHIKNRDMLISTIAATMAMVISYIAYMAKFAAIFGGGRDDERGNILEIIILAIIAPIAAMLIQMAISRSREFIADESGARIVRNGEPLASALLKLESNNKSHPLRLGTDSTNHMMIVNPFRGTGRAFVNLFSTHPAVNVRVEKLRGLKL